MATSIEIKKKTAEPLMKRTLFSAKMVFEGKTPSRLDIKKELAHALGAKPELLVVRKITTDYGSERAMLEGYFYEDETAMKTLENKHVLLRHLSTEEQKKEKDRLKEAKAAAKSAAQAAKKKK